MQFRSMIRDRSFSAHRCLSAVSARLMARVTDGYVDDGGGLDVGKAWHVRKAES